MHALCVEYYTDHDALGDIDQESLVREVVPILCLLVLGSYGAQNLAMAPVLCFVHEHSLKAAESARPTVPRHGRDANNIHDTVHKGLSNRPTRASHSC